MHVEQKLVQNTWMLLKGEYVSSFLTECHNGGLYYKLLLYLKFNTSRESLRMMSLKQGKAVILL